MTDDCLVVLQFKKKNNIGMTCEPLLNVYTYINSIESTKVFKNYPAHARSQHYSVRNIFIFAKLSMNVLILFVVAPTARHT